MTDIQDDAQLTDADKLGLRPGLSRLLGALMRAWLLGMFVPTDPEAERLVARIEKLLVMPEVSQAGDSTPLGLRVPQPPNGETDDHSPSSETLTLLTDDEYLASFDGLVARFKALKAGYDSGMVIANTPEQKQQLDELRTLLDD